MAPVDDALDRLEHFLANGDPRANPMVDIATVRSALELLRANQRTGHIIHGDATDDAWNERAFDQQKARAEAAEAELQRLRGGISVRDALVTENAIRAAAAEAEVQRLREERDGWEKIAEGRADYIEGWQLDAKVDELRAAEAEVRRYREGLREIVEEWPEDSEMWQWAQRKARALLADSPTDGGERHAEGLDERGIYGGRAYPDGGGAK